MTDETLNIDGREFEHIARSGREGVDLYQEGETVAVSTAAIRESDGPDAVLLTYDELKNLLVDARPHFEEDDDGSN